MIFGVGIDIVETDRIKKNLQNEAFLKKVFTEKEILLCKKSSISVQKYAARFSAKEAFMKAIGTGWAKGIKFNEIEILNESSGKPIIKLLGETKAIFDELQLKTIHISMSHIREIVSSVVIIEK